MKVLMITERRADYSRIKPILSLLSKDDKFDYSLIVTGMHLLEDFGSTYREIEKDGFEICHTFSMFDHSEEQDACHMVEGLGRCLIELPSIVSKEKPDLILTGFDIAANLALTIVGAHLNIPVGHIQGGEVTGTIDESIRHAMTKFSHLHFAGNEDACERLVKLGEIPENVFNVGCPSIDSLLEVDDDPSVLQKFDLNQPFYLVLQHPVTSEYSETDKQIEATLNALKSTNKDVLIILPNNDAGSRFIIDSIKNSNFKSCKSLSISDYVNLLKRCDMLIGNSSSGIHESHVFGIPTVNIGTRQAGRLQSNNVINCGYSEEEILTAIEEAEVLRNKKFTMPYGSGDAAQKIVEILSHLDLSKINIQKQITY